MSSISLLKIFLVLYIASVFYILDKIGCFEIPNTLEPVLSSFNSMELTLCKQLCLSIGEEVAMMTSDSCYCLSRMLLFTMNSSMSRSCWNQCAHHNLQLCGTVDGAVAYSLGK